MAARLRHWSGRAWAALFLTSAHSASGLKYSGPEPPSFGALQSAGAANAAPFLSEIEQQLTKRLRRTEELEQQVIGGGGTFNPALTATPPSTPNPNANPAKHNHLALADSSDIFETFCTRDYSVDCPRGWSTSVDGEWCVAGPSYAEPGKAYFKKVEGEEAKKAVEANRNVRWPCNDPCRPDFSYVCPLDWTETSDGRCVQGVGGVGGVGNGVGRGGESGCKAPFVGAGMTLAEKEALALRCDLHWPCESACDKDFRDPCPLGWRLASIEGVRQCEASPHYTGGCVALQAINTFDFETKKLFEKRCAASWPCQQCSPTERDYISAPCPEFWIFSGSSVPLKGICEAPEDYNGPCPRSYDAALAATKEEKQGLESRCDLLFPCLSEDLHKCVRDYESHLCPVNWKEVKLGFCSAPADYKGRCPGEMSFARFTASMKEQMSKHCGFFYPCRDSEGRPLLEAPGSAGRLSKAPPPQGEGSVSATLGGGPVSALSGEIVFVHNPQLLTQ